METGVFMEHREVPTVASYNIYMDVVSLLIKTCLLYTSDAADD